MDNKTAMVFLNEIPKKVTNQRVLKKYIITKFQYGRGG
jgi:hypothetical protein